jgi:hypothetical protein
MEEMKNTACGDAIRKNDYSERKNDIIRVDECSL